jgi:hypothetical protein
MRLDTQGRHQAHLVTMRSKPELVDALRTIANENLAHPEADERLYELATILLHRVNAWARSPRLDDYTGTACLVALGELQSELMNREGTLSPSWYVGGLADQSGETVVAELREMVTF